MSASNTLFCVHEMCTHPPKANGYCGKHQRYFTLKDAEEKGIKYCRFFLRGCTAIIEPHEKTCSTCLAKKHDGKIPCAHEGCKFHVKGDAKYCKKHGRDVYRDEEKEKGIKYCDIARGCFNLLTGEKASCEACLEKEREKDRALFEKRKTLLSETKGVKTMTERICVDCGNGFEAYLTRYNKEGKRCSHCRDTMAAQDAKRSGRVRKYNEERLKASSLHFKEYYTNAHERGYEFTLTLEQFQELVVQPCYYCNVFSPTEANGLDRINNDIGYTPENCKSCCGICNRMKSFYHPVFFVEKVKHIANETYPLEEFHKTWDIYYSRSCSKSYAGFLKEATEKRGLTVELTFDQWNSLSRSPCYLCGYSSAHGIGLDRIDNSVRTYSMANCLPCCGSCNTMKHYLDGDVFTEKCKAIDAKWSDITPLLSVPLFSNPYRPEYTAPAEDTVAVKWNSKKLYHAILSNTCTGFLEFNKEVLDEDEWDDFKEDLQAKYPTQEAALPVLKAYLAALNQRRSRFRRANEKGVKEDDGKACGGAGV
jgi:hypothetical protein